MRWERFFVDPGRAAVEAVGRVVRAAETLVVRLPRLCWEGDAADATAVVAVSESAPVQHAAEGDQGEKDQEESDGADDYAGYGAAGEYGGLVVSCYCGRSGGCGRARGTGGGRVRFRRGGCVFGEAVDDMGVCLAGCGEEHDAAGAAVVVLRHAYAQNIAETSAAECWAAGGRGIWGMQTIRADSKSVYLFEVSHRGRDRWQILEYGRAPKAN